MVTTKIKKASKKKSLLDRLASQEASTSAKTPPVTPPARSHTRSKSSKQSGKDWQELRSRLSGFDRTLTKDDVGKIIKVVKASGSTKLEQHLGSLGATVRRVVESFLNE